MCMRGFLFMKHFPKHIETNYKIYNFIKFISQQSSSTSKEKLRTTLLKKRNNHPTVVEKEKKGIM